MGATWREVRGEGLCCEVFDAGVKEGGVTHHSCATEGISRARYSVLRRLRVLNTDVVGSKRCLRTCATNVFEIDKSAQVNLEFVKIP